VDAGGQTVFLESPMGIFENKSGWILMLGFTPPASGPQLEADFLKILKSARETLYANLDPVIPGVC
jgi:hypothetical protein